MEKGKWYEKGMQVTLETITANRVYRKVSNRTAGWVGNGVEWLE